jgi:hypothetical protein
MNYTIVALVFVVLIMLYVGYLYAINTDIIKNAVYLPTTTDNQLDTIKWDKLTSPASTTYHYQGWLYLKTKSAASSTNIPVIFYRGGNDPANTQLILAMNGTSLNLYSNASITDGEITSAGAPILTIISDFPLQKWTHFVINVSNGSIISCFINGKLIKTLQAPPPASNGIKPVELTPDTRSALIIGGKKSVKAYITKFKREPVVLSIEEVRNTYLEGNGLSSYTKWLGGYGASFTIFTSEGDIQKLSF